ncbi:MAG: OsmC family protein [Bacteroidota bacterium]
MVKLHYYNTTVTWTGNNGPGTTEYKSYERSHEIKTEGKPVIRASSDPVFRGDKTKYNPEELLVASLSGCHMLWYLHLCAVNGIVVTEYVDEATSVMEENADGSGQFKEVTLNPRVTVTEQRMVAKANELHHEANKMCFMARSVNFPVHHKPVTVGSAVSLI